MAETVLAVRRLCKQYGGTLALDHVDLHVDRGQIYGLVGKNGAGKTTLIRTVTAQTIPTSGEIELFGATGERELRHMRARLGAVVETPSFYPFLTAAQNLEYYRLQRGIAGKTCVEEALQLVGLTGTGRKKFKNFSLGMKQRLGLALSIMSQPDFLILDEPINGLDPTGIVQFREILQRLNEEKNTTILISSHILSELSNLATHYGFIDGGHMLQQISAREIAERCRECLELLVSDTEKAAVALERDLGIDAFEILPENRIRLYALVNEPGKVAQVLAAAGVVLTGINTRGTNLEEYFLSLIGETQKGGPSCSM